MAIDTAIEKAVIFADEKGDLRTSPVATADPVEIERAVVA
jgi:hypothetical protein